MSIRTEKVASVVKKVVADSINEIATEYKAGLATVTSVRISKDLLLAKIYISVFNGKVSPAAFISILDDNKGRIRSSVASQVRMKFTPDLKFYLDDTLDQIDQIQSLVNKVKSESPTEIKYNPEDYDLDEI